MLAPLKTLGTVPKSHEWRSQGFPMNWRGHDGQILFWLEYCTESDIITWIYFIFSFVVHWPCQFSPDLTTAVFSKRTTLIHFIVSFDPERVNLDQMFTCSALVTFSNEEVQLHIKYKNHRPQESHLMTRYIFVSYFFQLFLLSHLV